MRYLDESSIINILEFNDRNYLEINEVLTEGVGGIIGIIGIVVGIIIAFVAAIKKLFGGGNGGGSSSSNTKSNFDLGKEMKDMRKELKDIEDKSNEKIKNSDIYARLDKILKNAEETKDDINKKKQLMEYIEKTEKENAKLKQIIDEVEKKMIVTEDNADKLLFNASFESKCIEYSKIHGAHSVIRQVVGRLSNVMRNAVLSVRSLINKYNNYKTAHTDSYEGRDGTIEYFGRGVIEEIHEDCDRVSKRFVQDIDDIKLEEIGRCLGINLNVHRMNDNNIEIENYGPGYCKIGFVEVMGYLNSINNLESEIQHELKILDKVAADVKKISDQFSNRNDHMKTDDPDIAKMNKTVFHNIYPIVKSIKGNLDSTYEIFREVKKSIIESKNNIVKDKEKFIKSQIGKKVKYTDLPRDYILDNDLKNPDTLRNQIKNNEIYIRRWKSRL